MHVLLGLLGIVGVLTPAAPVGRSRTDAERVTIGVYLKDVPDIDVKSNTYLADFYIWFRWQGTLDPTRTFELTNAVESWDIMKVATYDVPETLPDGSHYQVYHIQTHLNHAFPLHDYPFDEQDLVIEVEDNAHQTDELTYVNDDGASNYHTGIEIPGWQLRKMTTTVTEAAYRTNFGDPRVKAGGDHYSHYTFSVHVTRPVFGYLIKTILPIAIVILITFVVFLIQSKYFEGRLGLAITSLISAVALQLTASGDLPLVGYMVLLDKVYDVSYLVIFLTLLESVIAVRLVDAGREADALRLDRIALSTLSLLFFGGVAAIILLR
jgi:hypothetical protein